MSDALDGLGDALPSDDSSSSSSEEGDFGTWASFLRAAWAPRPLALPGKVPRAPAPPPRPAAAALAAALADLRTAYALPPESAREFAATRRVRLRGAVPPAAAAECRAALAELAARATGGANVSLPAGEGPAGEGAAERWARIAEPATRSYNLQMMWAVEPIVRQLVLSPRIGVRC